MIKTKRYIFLALLIFLTTFNPELPLLKLGFFIIKTVNVSGSKNTDLEKIKKQFNFLVNTSILSVDNKKMNEIINELPKTYQTPTMAPFCKDEEKYLVVEDLIKQVEVLKLKNTKIDNQSITDILTVNGVRFSLDDGSWGLIRASSNKPSLVVVTESPTSNERKKKIFDFIDNLLQKTGKIGEYDQKI